MKKSFKEDIRNAPLYSQSEASRYLRISKSTLRYWAIGEDTARRSVKPLVLTPSRGAQLSFLNLVELHVVNSIRTDNRLRLSRIRTSLNYVQKKLGIERPLLDVSFETDGVDLFIRHLNNTTINVSREGQQAMREVLALSLRRISRDSHKIPLKLFPFTHSDWQKSPAVISMNPSIYSGRPVIDGTGIATSMIAERYKAGESVKELARDYNQRVEAIEEAIRCELEIAA